MAYWHRLPSRQQYAWVNRTYDHRWVDYAARYTYAWGYDGTGTGRSTPPTPARFGLDAFVTRLRSLREAELFIRAGIPLVASISFGRGELDGAPDQVDERPPRRDPRVHGRRYASSSTTPPRRSNAGVRRVYRRGQFENAWSDNGGVVYVIHPRSKALPAPAHHSNW